MTRVYFDIDYTLYDQRQYLRHAFRRIADTFGGTASYTRLYALWKKRGTRYPTLFDEFLAAIHRRSLKNVQRCIHIFHTPKSLALTPYADVIPTFRALAKAGIKLGIITDGHLGMQRAKVRALDLARYMSSRNIQYSAHYHSSKARPELFRRVRATIAPSETDFWYVGDNPATDFVHAHAAGFKTVRILRGEFKRMETVPGSVDHTIRSLRELPKLLAKGTATKRTE